MSAVCNQNCIKINSGMIEIEYDVKEDMYVSCVMCRSQPGPWTAWVLTAATSNGPTEHRSAEAAQEILKAPIFGQKLPYLRRNILIFSVRKPRIRKPTRYLICINFFWSGMTPNGPKANIWTKMLALLAGYKLQTIAQTQRPISL